MSEKSPAHHYEESVRHETQQALGEIAALDCVLHGAPQSKEPIAASDRTDIDAFIPQIYDRGKMLTPEEYSELHKNIDAGMYAGVLLEHHPERQKIKVNEQYYTREELEAVVEQGKYARERFVDSHTRFIHFLISKRRTKGDFDDKFSASYQAMYDTLDSFNPAKSRWTTYATRPISWALSRVSENWYREFGFSNTERVAIQDILDAMTHIERGGKTADTASIAAHTNIPAKEVARLTGRYYDAVATTRLKNRPGKKENPDADERDREPHTGSIDAYVDQIITREELRTVLACIAELPPNQAEALRYAAGLIDGETHSLSETGRYINRSPTAAFRRLELARKNLKALVAERQSR